MQIRHATAGDLAAIVAIYNASIPERMATADVEAVSVESRREWFAAFDPARRPLWLLEEGGAVLGWLGLRSFYGRPAYHRTVESAVYVAPEARRRGVAARLLDHALRECPALGIHNVLAFVFAHNMPSVVLFEARGFAQWGRLPGVCELDGVERDVLILGKRLA
jgi:phosphinothricin acetyltransferase